VRDARVEHRMRTEDRLDIGLAFGGASSRQLMADGLAASSAANSCGALIFWEVARLGSPLPPRAFEFLLRPAAYWPTAPLVCRGGFDRSACPESIDVSSES
jgi:hypothetical protein